MSTPDELFENLKKAKVALREAKRNRQRLEDELEKASRRQNDAAVDLQAAKSAIDYAAEPAEAG